MRNTYMKIISVACKVALLALLKEKNKPQTIRNLIYPKNQHNSLIEFHFNKIKNQWNKKVRPISYPEIQPTNTLSLS